MKINLEMAVRIEELRIGNWVSWGGMEGYITVFNNNKVVIKCNKSIHKCYVEDLNPIPLTEQWLLDFGFEKKQTDVFSLSLDYDVFLFITLLKNGESLTNLVETGLYSDNVCLRKTCKYVHQLQNLVFAIYGKELERKEAVT